MTFSQRIYEVIPSRDTSVRLHRKSLCIQRGDGKERVYSIEPTQESKLRLFCIRQKKASFVYSSTDIHILCKRGCSKVHWVGSSDCPRYLQWRLYNWAFSTSNLVRVCNFVPTGNDGTPTGTEILRGNRRQVHPCKCRTRGFFKRQINTLQETSKTEATTWETEAWYVEYPPVMSFRGVVDGQQQLFGEIQQVLRCNKNEFITFCMPCDMFQHVYRPPGQQSSKGQHDNIGQTFVLHPFREFDVFCPKPHIVYTALPPINSGFKRFQCTTTKLNGKASECYFVEYVLSTAFCTIEKQYTHALSQGKCLNITLLCAHLWSYAEFAFLWNQVLKLYNKDTSACSISIYTCTGSCSPQGQLGDPLQSFLQSPFRKSCNVKHMAPSSSSDTSLLISALISKHPEVVKQAASELERRRVLVVVPFSELAVTEISFVNDTPPCIFVEDSLLNYCGSTVASRVYNGMAKQGKVAEDQCTCQGVAASAAIHFPPHQTRNSVLVAWRVGYEGMSADFAARTIYPVLSTMWWCSGVDGAPSKNCLYIVTRKHKETGV